MSERLQELLNRKPKKWSNVSIKTFEQDLTLLQETIVKQQEEINHLKTIYDERCKDINFYYKQLERIVKQIETDFTQEQISQKDVNSGFTNLIQVIYEIAKKSTNPSPY